MSLAPESAVLQEQYVQLLQRISITDPTVNRSVPANSTTGISSGGVTIPIPTGEAARIAFGWCNLSDNPNTGFLTLQGGHIDLSSQNGAGTFFYGFPCPVGNVKLGSSGVDITAQSDELIYYNDLPNLGGIPPGVKLQIFADVTNSDASAHNVLIQALYIIEFYLLKPSGLIGFSG